MVSTSSTAGATTQRAVLFTEDDPLRLVNGRTLAQNIEGAEVYNDDVIRQRENALIERDGRSWND